MANIEIPIQSAGIGDAIAIQNGTTGESISHFKAYVGASVTATPPSGYTWYGIVYGRERRGLMIHSVSPSTQRWINVTVENANIPLSNADFPNVVNATIGSYGKMRNGLAGSYPVMSLALCAANNKNNAQTEQNLHPTNGNYSWGTAAYRCMSKANFDADLHGAKTLYGTWRNYVAQMLPMLNTGPFQFRCGRASTKEMAESTALTYNGAAVPSPQFPAANYCYNHKRTEAEAEHHWWLPDMYELYMMMRDESFDRCYATHSKIGSATPKSAYRWSSVRCGSTSAWTYYGDGFANAFYFYRQLSVCPVTLLTL